MATAWVDATTCVTATMSVMYQISPPARDGDPCDMSVMAGDAERAFWVGGLIGGFLALCMYVLARVPEAVA